MLGKIWFRLRGFRYQITQSLLNILAHTCCIREILGIAKTNSSGAYQNNAAGSSDR